jgi:predicted nucleic acid-binding protein
VIVADTGPLVALFDPQDPQHLRCVNALKGIREPLYTTVPVLSEAFHILQPASIGSDRLRDFVVNGGMALWFFGRSTLARAFELMERYADHPMDLADASVIAAAESLGSCKVLTLDRRDFRTYRVRRGHRFHSLEILP